MTEEILPQLHWKLSACSGKQRRMLNSIFRDWHRAHLLGLEVEELEIAGRKKTAADLQRLNFWIAAGGAWRASALPYWDAAGLLSDVLSGELGVNFKVGTAGAGRSCTAAVFPLRWYQPQHFQGELKL